MRTARDAGLPHSGRRGGQGGHQLWIRLPLRGPHRRSGPIVRPGTEHPMTRATTVLSFDVEEHYRIEAAAHLSCPDGLKQTYSERADTTTRDLLGLLEEAGCKATFFILGELGFKHPKLVRDIHEA